MYNRSQSVMQFTEFCEQISQKRLIRFQLFLTISSTQHFNAAKSKLNLIALNNSGKSFTIWFDGKITIWEFRWKSIRNSDSPFSMVLFFSLLFNISPRLSPPQVFIFMGSHKRIEVFRIGYAFLIAKRNLELRFMLNVHAFKYYIKCGYNLWYLCEHSQVH